MNYLFNELQNLHTNAGGPILLPNKSPIGLHAWFAFKLSE